MQALFKLLENNGGAFDIVDVDERKALVVYDRQRQENRSDGYRWHHETARDSDPRMLMAGAALFAEQFILQVPPVRCKLRKRVGKPAVIVERELLAGIASFTSKD
jgi:hypothetical protein